MSLVWWVSCANGFAHNTIITMQSPRQANCRLNTTCPIRTGKLSQFAFNLKSILAVCLSIYPYIYTLYICINIYEEIFVISWRFNHPLGVFTLLILLVAPAFTGCAGAPGLWWRWLALQQRCPHRQDLILPPDQWLPDCRLWIASSHAGVSSTLEWWWRCRCDLCDPGQLFGPRHWIKCGEVESGALMLLAHSLTHSSSHRLYFPSLSVSTMYHKNWILDCHYEGTAFIFLKWPLDELRAKIPCDPMWPNPIGLNAKMNACNSWQDDLDLKYIS